MHESLLLLDVFVYYIPTIFSLAYYFKLVEGDIDVNTYPSVLVYLIDPDVWHVILFCV